MKYSCVQEKMEKRKIKITLEILIEVSVEVPESKQFNVSMKIYQWKR